VTGFTPARSLLACQGRESFIIETEKHWEKRQISKIGANGGSLATINPYQSGGKNFKYRLDCETLLTLLRERINSIYLI
jgi:hypothetical protein